MAGRARFDVEVSIPQLASKKYEDFWGSVKATVFGLLTRVVSAVVDYELEGFVGARWHERNAPGRGTTRAGYRPRRFTVLGHDVMLRIPRARVAGFRSKFLEFRQRRHAEFDEAVVDLYVGGCSTRETTAVLWEMFGTTVSPRTVSTLVGGLDAERARFHSRPLRDEYAQLVFDGMRVPCLVAPAPKLKGLRRGEGRTELTVLLVRGVKADGTRELVDFRVAGGEAEESWERFLRTVFARGLQGRGTKLFVHDGSEGLEKAIDDVYGAVSQQRCICHKLGNVWDAVADKERHRHIRREAAEVYDVASEAEAWERMRAFCQRWREREPVAVATLRRDFAATLRFLEVPRKHRHWVTTTNPLECYIRELPRRTRPMGIFQGLASSRRLIYVAIRKLSNERRNAIPYSLWTSQPWYGTRRRRRRRPHRQADVAALHNELYMALMENRL